MRHRRAPAPHLEAMRQTAGYERERHSPMPGDRYYLHLSDLLCALQTIATTERVRVLDFGAGLSPYRTLFPNADYRRADVGSSDAVDYVIADGHRIAESDGSFDVVLSTQVLEHVGDPPAYLAECHRVLAPGGRLVITTHGCFEDHPCPTDLYRWTAAGLATLLEDAGFSVAGVQKLTTGPRALAFFGDRYVEWERPSRRTVPGLTQWLVQAALRPLRARVHRHFDKYYRAHRVVPADIDGHQLYVAVVAVAVRPAHR